MVRNVIDLTASDPPDIAPEVRQPFIDLPTSTIAKTLEVAIADANSDRLRATLRAVCRASKQTQALAQSLLLADDADARHVQIERNCNSDGFLTGSDDEEESEGRQDLESQPHLPRLLQDVSSMKRPRPRYVTCDNCDEEFDVTANGKYDCRWHPGEKEVDWDGDFWADHDEDCHGRIEDLGDEFPEGFAWDCCDRLGDQPGCKIGTHEEANSSYKRAKYLYTLLKRSPDLWARR